MSRTLGYAIFNLLLTFALAEGICRLMIQREDGVDYLFGKKWRYVLPFDYNASGVGYPSDDSSGYRVYDSLLGWSHGRWKSSELYHSDDKGFRCSKSFSDARKPGPSHFDIACIGNSFTHGDGVLAEDTWPHLLEGLSGRSVLNMGVGGYGIDQAILRFMHSGKTCDTVVLGLVAGDLERSLTTVYNYFVGGTKTKPKFRFSDTGYSLSNVPCLSPVEFVRRPLSARARSVYEEIDGYHDYASKEGRMWTRSMFLRVVYSSLEQNRHRKPPVYMTPGPDLDYCMRVFRVFKDHCDRIGVVPIVLLIDNINTLEDRLAAQGNTWALMQRRLSELGLESVQFQEEVSNAYRADRSKVIHPEEKVHYSPEGHRLLAGLLAGRLDAAR